ncbi:MAG TPA: hypothetical protein GX745_03730 [Clostridiales bacterium]|nr:hypothetical protein [Clostridiales bacterium]
MNSHLYIIGNDNILITVNGVFLGNAATPITFYTEENALLYFWAMPLESDYKPFAFSLRVNPNMTLPQEFGTIIALPARRYELRLCAPKYQTEYEPPIKKILQSIKVKAESSQNNFQIAEQVNIAQITEKNSDDKISNNIIEQKINNSEDLKKQTNSKDNLTRHPNNNIQKTSVKISQDNKDDIQSNSISQNPVKSNSQKSNQQPVNKTKPAQKGAAKNYIVSLINDGADRLCIEYGKDVFYHALPKNLKNLTLKAEMLNSDLVAAVTAQKEDDNLKDKYLLVIKGKPKKYEVKIEGFFDLIHQEGKKISALKLNRDIALRGKVSVFDGQTLEKSDEYYVYVNKEPNRAQDIRLMPIAVFEAVKCKDFSEAKYYLTDSLNEILTEQKLEEFFEDYVEILPNNYYSQYPHSFLLIDKNNKASLFKAVYKNNKIDNFFEIEFK